MLPCKYVGAFVMRLSYRYAVASTLHNIIAVDKYIIHSGLLLYPIIILWILESGNFYKINNPLFRKNENLNCHHFCRYICICRAMWLAEFIFVCRGKKDSFSSNYYYLNYTVYSFSTIVFMGCHGWLIDNSGSRGIPNIMQTSNDSWHQVRHTAVDELV